MRRSNRQPARDATEFASESTSRSICLLVAEVAQRQDGHMPYRARRTYGGEAVERMDEVSGKVLGRMKRKFKERTRPGVCKAKGSDENPVVDAGGVHVDSFIQDRLLQKVKDLVGL